MKKTELVRKANSLPLAALFLVAITLFFASCNDEQEETPNKKDPPKVNCVTLTKAQVQNWVDSGWTKPGSPGKISEVVLQFFSTNGGASLQLLGYPGSTPITVRDNGKVVLATDTTCKKASFNGDVIWGNNILKLDSLGIFNRDGGLNDFDFIRLTPEQKYPPYVNFKVDVVTKGQVGDGTGTTLPCPTQCD